MRLPSFRHLQCLLLLVLCTTLASCASLPSVQTLNTSVDVDAPKTPTIETANGVLSRKQAAALLAQRLRTDQIDLPDIASLEEAATDSPLIAGNKVTLLNDGPQTIAAMIEAIKQATDSIDLETYIFDEGMLGDEFSDLLIRKQRAGVQVNIIYDGVGCIDTPAAFFQKLRAAGISLLEFHPVNPLKRLGRGWRINNRDHRKILVVDGKVAFTGGINISDDYSSGSLFHSRAKSAQAQAHLGWRDTHVRVEGPAASAFQWLFMQTWVSQTGKAPPKRNYFPALKPVGQQVVRVIGSEPGGSYQTYKAYMLAIEEAKKTIHITNAYFVPDQDLVHALIRAARRGVDVKIIFPGISDTNLVRRATQSYYAELLAGGVHIYELQGSVLHAKTAVIDGYWSTVGSTNLDMRSFLHNREVNMITLDAGFGAQMESTFNEDLKHSVEITPEKWAQRPLIHRFGEWLARRLAYWL